MKKINTLFGFCMALALLAMPAVGHAQLTTPPGGGNQKAKVVQYMGMVKTAIVYNSPDVHAPNGDDRNGHIWGELVPYGMTNLGSGTAKESPWRAGANEKFRLLLLFVGVGHQLRVIRETRSMRASGSVLLGKGSRVFAAAFKVMGS